MKTKTGSGDLSVARKRKKRLIRGLELKEMKISITAQLARPALTFEEMMNLQVDDILLLDRGINEPVELMVGNMTVHRGWPSKSDGQYALVITEDSGLQHI